MDLGFSMLPNGVALKKFHDKKLYFSNRRAFFYLIANRLFFIIFGFFSFISFHLAFAENHSNHYFTFQIWWKRVKTNKNIFVFWKKNRLNSGDIKKSLNSVSTWYMNVQFYNIFNKKLIKKKLPFVYLTFCPFDNIYLSFVSYFL